MENEWNKVNTLTIIIVYKENHIGIPNKWSDSWKLHLSKKSKKNRISHKGNNQVKKTRSTRIAILHYIIFEDNYIIF